MSKQILFEESGSDWVRTPGGTRPKKNVHHIESNYQVSVKGGSAKKVSLEDGSVVKKFGKINKSFSRTKKIKEDIFRKSIDGVTVKAEKALDGRPITDQWIIYSKWKNSSQFPIVYFSTKWTVPEPPATQNDQLIYLFNGIENADRSFIIQPVLQWGVSNAGGGPHWSVASWFVGLPESGIALYGSLIDVYPNQELQGVITAQKQTDGLFTYRSSFQNIPYSELVVTDCEELVLATEALECYYLTAFSDYPNSPLTAMREIEIRLDGRPVSIRWEPCNQVVDNGQRCEVVSNASPGGRVDLHYRRINA